MPSDQIQSHDVALRNANEGRADSTAPGGMASARHPYPRPVSHVEEGDADTRGEWWSLLKAVLIGALAIMLIGWLIAR